MREVVNVQLGTFANYVGAHYWNLQDDYIATPIQKRELSPAVLFRESTNPNLPYAPRVQIVDFSGAFGSLSIDNGAVLAETPQKIDALTWDGPCETFRQERIPPSSYVTHLLEEERTSEASQEESRENNGMATVVNTNSEADFGLDQGVEFWTDYSKTRLHPRSCVALPGTHFKVTEFDKFDHGTQLANSVLLDEMYDQLRFFIEDCDSLGGVHITANASDGFSGLSAKYLTRMRDELGSSAGIFVVGAVPEVDYASQGFSSRDKFLKLWDSRIAEARLVADCINLSMQYVPVDAATCSQALEYVHPVQFNDYHSAAVLALGLDVAFSPLQISDAHFSTGSLSSKLRYNSSTILSSLFTQFPLVADNRNEQGIMHYSRSSMAKLSNRSFFSKITAPQLHRRRRSEPSQVVSEMVCSRGCRPQPGVHAPLDQSVTLSSAFPKFFDSRLSRDGLLLSSSETESTPITRNRHVERVSCLSGFATSPADGSTLLRNFGYAVSQSTLRPSSRQTAEMSNLIEIAEQLTSLSSDYSAL